MRWWMVLERRGPCAKDASERRAVKSSKESRLETYKLVATAAFPCTLSLAWLLLAALKRGAVRASACDSGPLKRARSTISLLGGDL